LKKYDVINHDKNSVNIYEFGLLMKPMRMATSVTLHIQQIRPLGTKL